MILPGTGRGTGEAGGGALPQTASPEAYTARKLRKAMSLPEVLIWQRLRSRASRVKFRRQHPIGPYVLDFFCGAGSIAIEIDGATHDARRDYDSVRDRYLKSVGITVIRINAADVLRDPDGVAASIVTFVAPPLHHASHGPPPRSGEDLE